MRIEVEVKKFQFNENYDEDLVMVRTRVFVDGRRERGLEQVLRKDAFRSCFDIIWEDMGRRLKLAYAIKEPTDGS